ncbi:MAG: T9SS type A sorting domain-containing protein, partial [Prolixibacteraceae bacterium]|nr:T9SS type A sorting domain-containing protein [Prolixibacteraceae bacterium]
MDAIDSTGNITTGDVWEFSTKQIPTNTSEIKESLTDDSKILIFPNPAKDKLYFRTDELLKTIEIYSVMGAKLIYINNPKNSIDISTLSNGVY